MNGIDLVKCFQPHYPVLATGITDSGTTAILFGRDEIAFDIPRQMLRLPVLGWQDVPGTDPDTMALTDWVAVYLPTPTEWCLAIGFGDPYSSLAARRLPTYRGRVLAVPYIMVTEPDSPFFGMLSVLHRLA